MRAESKVWQAEKKEFLGKIEKLEDELKAERILDQQMQESFEKAQAMIKQLRNNKDSKTYRNCAIQVNDKEAQKQKLMAKHL